jgi:hypothetical protein
MATAIARQQNIIEIRGVDNASEALNKAASSMAGLQRQTEKTGKAGKKTADEFGKGFAAAGDEAAGRAGKLSTALSSLGDFAGQSEGKFRQASEAAGAFDDVLTLLPGPIGLAAAAAAGLTTILVLQAKAAREDKAALDFAFGGDVSVKIRKIGDDLGLSREAMIALGNAARDTNRPLESMRDDLQDVVERAEDVGQDGSAAVLGFAKSLSEAVTDTDRLRGRLRALGVEVGKVDFTKVAGVGQAAEAKTANKDFEEELANREKILQAAAAREKAVLAGRITAVKKVGAIGRLARALLDSDETKAIRKRASARLRLQATIDRKAAEDSIYDLKNTAREKEAIFFQQAKETAAFLKAESDRALADNAEASRILAVERAKREDKREAAARQRRRARSQRAAAARKAEIAKEIRDREEGVRRLIAFDRSRLETSKIEAEAQSKLAVTDEARIAAARELARLTIERAAFELQSGDVGDEGAARRLAAVKAVAKLELDAKIKAIRENGKKVKAEEAKVDQDRISAQIALFSGALQRLQVGASGSAASSLTKGLAAASTAAADVAANMDKIPIAADKAAAGVAAVGSIAIDFDTARSQNAIDADTKQRLSTAKTEEERARIIEEGEARKAAAVEAGERRKAAILALIEVARAAAAYPKIPEMAAHGLAAGLFGAIAGGAIGTSAPGAGGGAGGGFNAGGGGGSGGGGGDAAAGQTNIYNFNQPLVTKAAIGKSVVDTQRSLALTGLDRPGGV